MERCYNTSQDSAVSKADDFYKGRIQRKNTKPQTPRLPDSPDLSPRFSPRLSPRRLIGNRPAQGSTRGICFGALSSLDYCLTMS